jgi:hypothetical protein
MRDISQCGEKDHRYMENEQNKIQVLFPEENGEV